MAKHKTQKSLDTWHKEEWGTKSGKNSTQGSKATGERYLPKKARAALSDKEYARSTAKKRASMRKGEQHSPNNLMMWLKKLLAIEVKIEIMSLAHNNA